MFSKEHCYLMMFIPVHIEVTQRRGIYQTVPTISSIFTNITKRVKGKAKTTCSITATKDRIYNIRND